jgi:hypothetical protein
MSEQEKSEPSEFLSKPEPQKNNEGEECAKEPPRLLRRRLTIFSVEVEEQPKPIPLDKPISIELPPGSRFDRPATVLPAADGQQFFSDIGGERPLSLEDEILVRVVDSDLPIVPLLTRQITGGLVENEQPSVVLGTDVPPNPPIFGRRKTQHFVSMKDVENEIEERTRTRLLLNQPAVGQADSAGSDAAVFKRRLTQTLRDINLESEPKKSELGRHMTEINQSDPKSKSPAKGKMEQQRAAKMRTDDSDSDDDDSLPLGFHVTVSTAPAAGSGLASGNRSRGL